MPTSLKTAASRAQDLFYQDYAPRDAFFDVADFKFHFATIYSEMFDAVFQQTRQMNKREDGFSNVEMTASWLIKDTVKVEPEPTESGYFAKTTYPIFGFGFDEFSYALDTVKSAGKCGCKLQKISRQEAQYLDISPVTSLCYYWQSSGNKISFINDIKEVIVSYVPAVVGSDDDCVISDLIVANVIKATLDIMFKSKNGNVVDEVNDGNTNETIETQVNPVLNKTQRS